MDLKSKIEKILSEILSDKHDCRVQLRFEKKVTEWSNLRNQHEARNFYCRSESWIPLIGWSNGTPRNRLWLFTGTLTGWKKSYTRKWIDMTHCQQATTRTRFDFEAFSASRRKVNKRKRIIKRAAHFAGFLTFWAVTLAVAALAILVAMITIVSMT